MENKVIENKKNVNIPFVAFCAVFGAFALSAIIVFWGWKDAEWVKVYQMAMRWLVLPVFALVASYAGTIEKAPKGLMWSCPIVFGVAIALVEYLTYSLNDFYAGKDMGSLSVVLILIGALASLFGFTFAKMDRVEKAREARVAKKRAEKAMMEKVEASAPTISEYEYNPASEFIPDENDTWADEVLAKEGYGEVKVDYVEPDSDFSVDSPDEVLDEAAVENAEDEHIEESVEENSEDEHVEDSTEEEVAEDTEAIEEEETASENEEHVDHDETSKGEAEEGCNDEDAESKSDFEASTEKLLEASEGEEEAVDEPSPENENVEQ